MTYCGDMVCVAVTLLAPAVAAFFQPVVVAPHALLGRAPRSGRPACAVSGEEPPVPRPPAAPWVAVAVAGVAFHGAVGRRSWAARMAAVEPTTKLSEPVAVYAEIVLPSPAEGPPRQEITVVDLMPHINAVLAQAGLREGSVTVVSRHTTCGVTINEWESRLARDLRTWLLRLAPPDDRSEVGSSGAGVAYEHNDIEARPESADERQRCLDNGWDVADPEVLQRWRDQEPINAHSHLAAMLLGASETVPVTRGRLVLGEWQSVMLVDTDGPRERKVGIQAIGFK